jgi:hypothetical protein
VSDHGWVQVEAGDLEPVAGQLERQVAGFASDLEDLGASGGRRPRCRRRCARRASRAGAGSGRRRRRHRQRGCLPAPGVLGWHGGRRVAGRRWLRRPLRPGSPTSEVGSSSLRWVARALAGHGILPSWRVAPRLTRLRCNVSEHPRPPAVGRVIPTIQVLSIGMVGCACWEAEWSRPTIRCTGCSCCSMSQVTGWPV